MSVDTSVEQKHIFGNQFSDDPKLSLLDHLLANLPQDQQVTNITEVMVTRCQYPKTVELVDGLASIMTGQDVSFRQVLREVYSRLPVARIDREYADIYERSAMINVQREAAVALREKILGEVIKGWRMVSRWHRWDEQTHSGRTYEPNVDADDCYQFVCSSYKKASYNGLVREATLKLIRGHLTPEKDFHYAPFTFAQLDPWINHPDTPSDFIPELLQAQIRLGGSYRFLNALNTTEPQPPTP